MTQQMQQASKPLTQDDGDEDDGGDSSGATDFYTSQLPTTLADSIKRAGGLGLAPELYDALAQKGTK